jgi:hypothetical protein
MRCVRVGAKREMPRQRLAGLERAYCELQEAFVASTRAASDVFDQMADQRAGLSREQRGELTELKIEIAKLTTVCCELREKQVETFRFARERETRPPVLKQTPKLDS